MKAKALLRIASILMLLHAVGHTFGALGWKNAPNAVVRRVLYDMEASRFDFMGRSVSLADFHTGYGLTMIGVLLLITGVLWLLSNDACTPLSRKISALMAIFLLFMTVIEYIYFFPFAAAFSFLAGVSTLLSIPFSSKEKN